MAIEHADFEGIERLAAVLGAEIVSTFDQFWGSFSVVFKPESYIDNIYDKCNVVYSINFILYSFE